MVDRSDELLKLTSYVQISKYREKTLKSIGDEVKIPTNIAKDSGIRTNHISKVLSELKSKEIVECINEEDRDNNKMNLKIIKKEPEIENDIIVNNNINNSNNINEYYSVKDKYENIDIKKIKVFLQYQTLNEINNMFILRDGRIITNQKVYYGDGDDEEDKNSD